ncbi:MAG: metallophosphoesterase family protein, partial [Prolixibacteraceae bacterium]|nr:metallophosphoesterase family protein [Prolixibacteraceae bacterium]
MKKTVKLNRYTIALVLFVLSGLGSCTTKENSVKAVMDKVVTQLYQTSSPADLQKLGYEQAMALFSPEDLETLATKHWMFDVNVPVVVSVMRSNKQQIVPFWLEKDGFRKTGMTMKNEQTDYEVWQKSFQAGRVGLGIHGLDNSGLHYFVSVAPQNSNDLLELSHFFPENQYVGTLNDGAFTYHDWDELVLNDVPENMKGQKLLTTVRGRGVESHLVGAFRSSTYPSSPNPDQILLTWSAEPATSMDIQWRTDTTVQVGQLRFRESGNSAEVSVEAEKIKMEDRLLMNDRYIHHFTARLRGLKPGTTYQYLIGSQAEWSDQYSFTTAANDDSFSFLWFGDTHFSPKFGEVLQLAHTSHSDAAFISIVGDLVSDGLHRNQWDDLLEYSKNVVCRKPLMAVPGNHDNRAGLGAQTYRDLFSYPLNAPEGVPTEQTYSFTYKNALFLMIDGTSPIEAQTAWIEKQLAETQATWKIAMFHFPPYNWEEPYLNIQKAWVPLFDKYHVDMVFGGHIHYYMRSKPMKGGQVVGSYNDGTAYIISVGIPSRNQEITDEPYAAV